MTQDTVADLERSRKEIENTIAKKEKDMGGLSAKLDDEQSLFAKMQKSIKEYQGHVEELEEELEAERQAQAKAKRQRSDLAREIEQLGERLNEAGGATHAQVELNKKREAEVGKLRRAIEETNIQQESILGAATDEIACAQASSDKSNRNLLTSLNDINKRVGEANLTLGDFEASKRKIAVENADLLHAVGDLDNNFSMLLKVKSSIAAQLEEVKSLTDNEARERSLLLGKFRNLEHEVDGAKEALDEESSSRDNVLCQVAKAEGDANLWRTKYKSEAVAKAEELEMTKMRLVARLTEGEGTIKHLNAKLSQVDRSRSKMQAELDEITSGLDQAQVLNAAMERKAKQFDKVIREWKHKVDSLSCDLDCSQKESRNASSDLFKVKSAFEESMLQLDEVRRENKTLSNEIKDIMDQISEGGRSIHEIDKIRKLLEAEKLELQAALEEAEATLEQKENKVLHAQLEMTQVRQEIEHRLSEKDEEFMAIKKNQSKALESMQSALETETNGKAEALRMKKKLESDVTDFELALEHANAGAMETQSTIKKYQNQVRDAQCKVDEESHMKAIA
ncbi:myosin heavy chain, muscle-like [Eurytemora carolleeae]|uniref:myosin heavy chain, muscle-like n=1 Tax=Eurytemora carolleeae TaxID=1294199 RepID=UPI000C7746C2|nr:myosin heavy chain, muscle-like [Eurytemora carolleeae]|eukprot:XP_023341907.1 myosin heavy chain, muscle-like [Eurytemora affinis]